MTDLHRQQFDISALGRRIHVERLIPASAATAPTIVFLHEGLGSIGQWGDFPAQLCERCALPGLVYDRWGYGRSEGLYDSRYNDYLHHEAQHSLPAVLAACGIEEPLLFGHSDGASIALLFAAAYPQRTRAVISEAAHVFVEEICLEGIRRAGHAFHQGKLRKGLQRYHGNNTDLMFAGWHDTWLRPERRAWDMQAELRNITCPTLVIQGQGDEYGTRAQVDAIANAVSGSVEIQWLPDCGHTPHHELRENVIDSSLDFMRRAGVVPHPPNS